MKCIRIGILCIMTVGALLDNASAQTPIKFNVLVNTIDKMPVPPASTLDAYAKSIRDKGGYLMRDDIEAFVKEMRMHLNEIIHPRHSESVRTRTTTDTTSRQFREGERIGLGQHASAIISLGKTFHSQSDSVFAFLLHQKEYWGRAELAIQFNKELYEFDRAWDADRLALSNAYREFQDLLNDTHYGEAVLWKNPKSEKSTIAKAQQTMIKIAIEITETCKKVYELASKIQQEPTKEPVIK